MSALSLHHVEFTLQGPDRAVEILRDVNFTAEPGESVALTGPSGSGKSSLVMLMAGLDLPTSGTIRIEGQDIVQMTEDQRARFRADHIGIVFQSFHLIPTMTALENTTLPLEFLGRKNALASAEQMLSRVGLGQRLHHYPAQLSGGEQQRVGLARAMIAEPPILLADEPTGNLDAENSERIADLLFAMQWEHNTCLVLVTHDPALAEKCARHLRMDEGTIA